MGGRRTRYERMLESALVALCTGAEVDLSEDVVPPEDLAAAARFHRIAPLAHARLAARHPGYAAGLLLDRHLAMMRHLRASTAIGVVARTLDDVPWLVYKGPALSEVAHPVAGLRTYGDIDLLVPPGQLRTAVDRLAEAGWSAVRKVDWFRLDMVPGEVDLMRPGWESLDLHWSPMLTRELRTRFPVSTDEVVARRTALDLGGVPAWTMDAADTLVHVCYHGAGTGAVKLGYLVDADRAAHRVEDWDAVVARARASGTAGHLLVVLGRAHAVLGTPLPDRLAKDLGLGTGFMALQRMVDTWWPVPGPVDVSTPASYLAQGVGRGAASSIGGATGRAARNLRLRMVRSTVTRHGTRAPFGDELLETYLAAVEDEAVRPTPSRTAPARPEGNGGPAGTTATWTGTRSTRSPI
ncbi:MAG: nucleotidyltransferase family protein [Nocardioides sp.]|uniref:nucleotidyltransferase family protein n=1 Tax=Nocardioides sp. TaxID=35761 RepID=UPI003D6C3ACB